MLLLLLLLLVVGVALALLLLLLSARAEKVQVQGDLLHCLQFGTRFDPKFQGEKFTQVWWHRAVSLCPGTHIGERAKTKEIYFLYIADASPV